MRTTEEIIQEYARVRAEYEDRIRADERERICQHIRTVLPELVAEIEAKEREACAKIADKYGKGTVHSNAYADLIRDEIRAREQNEPNYGCVCAETSTRNCPEHANPDSPGNLPKSDEHE